MRCRQRTGPTQRPHREDGPCWAPPLPNLGNPASARRLRPPPQPNSETPGCRSGSGSAVALPQRWRSSELERGAGVHHRPGGHRLGTAGGSERGSITMESWLGTGGRMGRAYDRGTPSPVRRERSRLQRDRKSPGYPVALRRAGGDCLEVRRARRGACRALSRGRRSARRAVPSATVSEALRNRRDVASATPGHGNGI